MSEQKKVVAWFTANGKHIPVFETNKRDTRNRYIAVSNSNQRQSDIAKNKEIADRLNGRKVNKLNEHSTSEEIKNFYKDRYNISVDDDYFYYNMDSKFLVNSTKNLDKLYAEFPILKTENYKILPKDFKHTNQIPEEFSDTTALSQTNYKNEIWLNTNEFHRVIFDKLEEAYTETVSEGRFPKNTSVYNILVHELGHKVEIAMAKSIGVAESELKANDIANIVVKASYKELPEGMFKTLNKARASISKYSATNYPIKDENGKTKVTIHAYEETFAEAISDYITNGNNASTFSKIIVNNIKSIINDL